VVIETGRRLDVEIGHKRLEKRRANGVITEDVFEKGVVGCDPINFGGKSVAGYFVPFFWNKERLMDFGWYLCGQKSSGSFSKKKGSLDHLQTPG
jgi:hypothetical protein